MPFSENKNEELNQILKKELELHGVNLSAEPWLNSPVIQNEFRFLLIPEIHEGKCFSYGSIFVNSFEEIQDLQRLEFPVDQISLARKMSNGEDWYVCYHQNQFKGLVKIKEGYSTESRLIRNYPPSGGLILNRNKQGVVKIYQGDNIKIHEQRNWNVRPNIKKAASNISNCLSIIDKKTMINILEFAFYLISPSPKTGAMIVWFIGKETLDQNKAVYENRVISDLKLSIHDHEHKKIIYHYLSQIDGATVINPDGKLLHHGLHLHYSTKSAELIPELRGTRHTTAIRFSYDISDAVIITISEDGPVSIFFNGVNITDLNIVSSHKTAREIKKKQPEYVEQVGAKSFPINCNHCKKTSMVEEVTIKNLNIITTTACHTCKSIIYQSNCFMLNSRPFREM